MKHPLTSKERRGLVAVAAAALLCVGSGFLFRSCGSRNAPASVIVIDNDSARGDSARSEKSEKSERSGKSRRSGKKGAKKKAPARTYPVREPLDEPCD